MDGRHNCSGYLLPHARFELLVLILIVGSSICPCTAYHDTRSSEEKLYPRVSNQFSCWNTVFLLLLSQLLLVYNALSRSPTNYRWNNISLQACLFKFYMKIGLCLCSPNFYTFGLLQAAVRYGKDFIPGKKPGSSNYRGNLNCDSPPEC